MSDENNSIASDENAQIAQRRAKLAALRAQGNPFPNHFRRDSLAAELHEKYGVLDNDALEGDPVRVKVAGRMMAKRVMGKASFAQIQDMSGRIQLFVQRDAISAEHYEESFKKWDVGDILGAEGTLFKTKTGELSVRVEGIGLLTKSLRPLPEKFHGLVDQEIRYRQRYLDLIMNEDTRKVFEMRTRIINFIRAFLTEHHFLEVETPMMHVIPGGATARPFKTHHNALGMDMFLRIAPELYLKRLVVGGFERVFEINRSFRNEGLSTRHNPEFTMLEFYCAYMEVNGMMDFIERLIRKTAEAAGGTKVMYQGKELDFAKPYARLTITDAIRKYQPEIDDDILNDKVKIKAKLKSIGVDPRPSDGLGALQLTLFENTVETKLHEPTFLIDYPAEVSPLARSNDKNPEITERFELYIAGREIANGFSELNDPEDQAARFQEQVKQKDAGDHEAMHYDADYIRALEYGLPPTAGAGIGIDRLVMLLTDSPSIRDVILFPQMRPE